LCLGLFHVLIIFNIANNGLIPSCFMCWLLYIWWNVIAYFSLHCVVCIHEYMAIVNMYYTTIWSQVVAWYAYCCRHMHVTGWVSRPELAWICKIKPMKEPFFNRYKTKLNMWWFCFFQQVQLFSWPWIWICKT
jgi:hypothetical protein